ncbi:MAG: DUF3822 family protein [Chitinophagales bacterium]
MIFTNPSQSRESILILEWGKHSLSFSVFHEKDNRVLATVVLPTFYKLFDFTKQEFARLIKEVEIFSYSYQKIICLVDSEFLTLVPEKLLGANAIEDYLQFNCKLPSGKLFYQKEKLLSTEYYAIYALPLSLKEALEESFHKVHFTYTNLSLLNSFSRLSQLESFFSFHLNTERITIFYYKDNKLLFFNSFEYLTDEDIVYHLLNVMQQLSLDNERELVYFSGSLELNSNREALIKSYIKYLKVLERTNKLNYQTDVVAIPSHYFVHHYMNCI